MSFIFKRYSVLPPAAFGHKLPLITLISGAGPNAPHYHGSQTEGDKREQKTTEKAQHRVADYRPIGQIRCFVFTVKSDSANCEGDAHYDTYRRRSRQRLAFTP